MNLTLTDGSRTVSGVLGRESSTHVWMRVRGQLHAFRKPKWRLTDVAYATDALWSD